MKRDIYADDLDTCGYPKISTAPSAWTEDPNLYASKDDQGRIWLIRNPASWEEWTDDKGRTFRRRPKPIPLHEAPSRAPTLRPRGSNVLDIGDRLLADVEGGNF